MSSFDFNLDEVLESALEDFEEDDKKQNEEKKKQIETKSTTNEKSAEQKQEEDNSKEPHEEEMVDEVKKLMESLSHGEFDKTLEDITKAIEKGEIPEFNDLNLENFGGLNDQMLEKLAEEFENKPEMKDIMANMMSQLVSKDMLYEPMKEISQKYPQWLLDNKEKVSPEEYQRYTKHAEMVRQICNVYENDPDNTDKVVELMQTMQDLGQPPLDMIQSLAPDLELNEDGFPASNVLPDLLQNSELAKNCSIM